MIMWYVADIIFAQKSDSSDIVQCESCDVMFEASSALIAYEKAEKWAAEHEKDNPFQFQYAGIYNIWNIDCDRPGDGTEVGGGFSEKKYFWHQIDKIIPDKNDIPIIKFEANKNVPLGKLISEEQKKRIRKVFDGEDQ